MVFHGILQLQQGAFGVAAVCLLSTMGSADAVPTDDSSSLMVFGITGICGLIAILYLFKLLSGPKEPPKVLPFDDFQPLPLIRKKVLSHDTCRYVLGLPEGHSLGLPIGQHISLKFTGPDGKAVQRSYTPVTDDSRLGEVELVVKVYRPLPPKFPDGGLMSQHLDSLKIGEKILVKGPKGHVSYKGRGKFTTKPLGKPLEERTCTQIGMMAGGTGITPMLQILQAILLNPKYRDSKTKIKLIYANQTPDDILVRDELEDLALEFKGRFELWYTVDKVAKEGEAPSEWSYSTGFITTDMVKEHLLFEGDNSKTQFFMCGPPPMIKYACIPALKECGMTEKNWTIF
uniref:NADH-cytochrome b5 reductase n=2 Tax=Entomoneis paludosa TaxID=265537 RepID=A0A7S3DQ42_9STRA|mmetsp:Transcript_27652/g.57876  ORF Transcript_27652/g.57876 Transcript_27652/m.57876 type:complete len:344 (+) Transcript_27652:137-1168(+)|eukprot:CAMPEP_0172467330 /NCGR_PEP_ID=MMETSP1065-20121228/58592_1 /TAXON_ID=265537 /ORGANISM="Amphiprora paludosa, Strain CCMP125" /LENGTH=343 /DNA_ID=CAMNT_0013224439 /DNA_START=16 /DNA_END=1047 /DNA_ORIENTATION=-